MRRGKDVVADATEEEEEYETTEADRKSLIFGEQSKSRRKC